jgi:hypothetical protein
MVLGMSLSTFTPLHVLISLAGIGTGFMVVYGMLNGKRLDSWTGIFLVTTVLTSATGFLFPAEHFCRRIWLGPSRWWCWRWRF